MRFNRISVAIAVTLAATLASTTAALAAPAPVGSTATPPAAVTPALKEAEAHVVKASRGRLVFRAGRPGMPGEGARPQQEEEFTCDVNYGITKLTPVVKDGKLTAYDADFGIDTDCEVPVFASAFAEITDLTTKKNLGVAATNQFGEEVDLDSSATLSVRNAFVEFYTDSLALLPDFVWISTTSPTCAGIGTAVLICSFPEIGVTF
jgi:hypothetical protein